MNESPDPTTPGPAISDSVRPDPATPDPATASAESRIGEAPDPTLRQRGQELMRQVYGWDFEPTKPFEVATVDHLFGRIWDEGDLTVKERRLLLIGLAVGTGQLDVAGLQLGAALDLDELSVDDLRTIVMFLAHYGGWPRAAALNSEVERLIATHDKKQ